MREVDGEKRQIDVGTHRGSLLYTESCSQYSPLNNRTHNTLIPPVFHPILAIQVDFEQLKPLHNIKSIAIEPTCNQHTKLRTFI